jgi:hypothetical protein
MPGGGSIVLTAGSGMSSVLLKLAPGVESGSSSEGSTVAKEGSIVVTASLVVVWVLMSSGL